jgi:hypothetical protein
MGLRTFLRRFLVHLGKRLQWSQTARKNYFILDNSDLPKQDKRLTKLSFAKDQFQGKTVKGYEILPQGLQTSIAGFSKTPGLRVSGISVSSAFLRNNLSHALPHCGKKCLDRRISRCCMLVLSNNASI